MSGINIYLHSQNSKHNEKSTADENNVPYWSERSDQRLNHQFQTRSTTYHPANIHGFKQKYYGLKKQYTLSVYLRGRSVRSRRRTRRMPKIRFPPDDAMETRMSTSDTNTSTPSKMFQLLCRYTPSPKYSPIATT